MKYVKVENGIYEKDKLYTFYNVFGNKVLKIDEPINQIDILKESDNIEDLVDGFWWENEMYTDPIFIPNYGLAIDRINAWKESDKKLKTNSLSRIKVYASIYVKGFGWKHIAKIHIESGELQLL